MKFGIFYEHQLPRPWDEGRELSLFQDALQQVEFADRLGIDFAWEVEHHFLEEYSHSSAPEVFLAAASQRSKRIRLGHGIVLCPPAYNHPARVAERIATLDLVSNGRVEFGTGESASRMELEGFRIEPTEKRAMWLEAIEQIGLMMKSEPLSRLRGQILLHAGAERRAEAGAAAAPSDVVGLLDAPDDPSRRAAGSRRADVLLHRSQRSAALGCGLLRDLQERVCTHRADGESEHRHGDRLHVPRKRRRGGAARLGGFPVLRLCAGALLPVRNTRTWNNQHLREFPPRRAADSQSSKPRRHRHTRQVRAHLEAFEATGVDQVVFIQQGGNNRHEDICASLELFAARVMPEFKEREGIRSRRRADELAPFVEKAMARKRRVDAGGTVAEVFAYGRNIAEGGGQYSAPPR